MSKTVTVVEGLSEAEMARFDDVRKRAGELGILDINFCRDASADSLKCYEQTLDIIAENLEWLDRADGEV